MKNAKATVTITAALLAVATLMSTTDAKCAFTSPTESSSFAAGESMPISWADNTDEGPKCAEITPTIELRVGSQDSQTTVATVASGIDGSAMGTSYDIPSELPKTADTFFLEMHDSAKGFQNFSARFKISGVKSIGGDPTDPGAGGKNGTDPDPSAGTAGGDEPDTKSNGTDSKDANDTSSPDTDKNTNENNDSPTTGQKGDKGSGASNQPSGGNNAGSPPANSNSTNSSTQPNAASSPFVSIASLAIVTVAVALSNLF